MPALSYDGPYTIISGMLPGETDREARQLVAQGFIEVFHTTVKEQLAPGEFFRVKTRTGTPAEEQWRIVRRTR
jgi:hypothetical protein